MRKVTPEQIARKREEIINACEQLYRTMSFREITLKEIGNMADMIEMQLKLMELDHFDVYWIHNVWDAPKWTEELAKYFEGKDNVPMIGVSNHNLAEIKEADAVELFYDLI